MSDQYAAMKAVTSDRNLQRKLKVILRYVEERAYNPYGFNVSISSTCINVYPCSSELGEINQYPFVQDSRSSQYMDTGIIFLRDGSLYKLVLIERYHSQLIIDDNTTIKNPTFMHEMIDGYFQVAMRHYRNNGLLGYTQSQKHKDLVEQRLRRKKKKTNMALFLVGIGAVAGWILKSILS